MIGAVQAITQTASDRNHLPLEGRSKFASATALMRLSRRVPAREQISGGGNRVNPRPPTRKTLSLPLSPRSVVKSRFSTSPQGGGGSVERAIKRTPPSSSTNTSH